MTWHRSSHLAYHVTEGASRVNKEARTGFGLLALGVGMAVNAILGPLGLGVIDSRVSDNMQNQLLGGEIVSLLLAAPVAVVAGVLWLRGSQFAPPLAIAPALYAVYTYVQFIVGPDYTRYDGNNERAFPLYLLLIVLGWAIAISAWGALGRMALPAPSLGLARILAIILIAISVLIGFAWIASIAGVISGGSVTQEYRDDPTLFWMIRLMDLGFVIPAGLMTAVGLLRHAVWSNRLTWALIGFQTLLTGSVASMAIAMEVRDDPSANPVLLTVTVVTTLALIAVSALLLRGLRQTPLPATKPQRPSTRNLSSARSR
jgi:hypothetical protein